MAQTHQIVTETIYISYNKNAFQLDNAAVMSDVPVNEVSVCRNERKGAHGTKSLGLLPYCVCVATEHGGGGGAGASKSGSTRKSRNDSNTLTSSILL